MQEQQSRESLSPLSTAASSFCNLFAAHIYTHSFLPSLLSALLASLFSCVIIIFHPYPAGTTDNRSSTAEDEDDDDSPAIMASSLLRSRVRYPGYLKKLVKPDDLLHHFPNNAYIGWSGFTGVGYPK